MIEHNTEKNTLKKFVPACMHSLLDLKGNVKTVSCQLPSKPTGYSTNFVWLMDAKLGRNPHDPSYMSANPDWLWDSDQVQTQEVGMVCNINKTESDKFLTPFFMINSTENST